MNTEQGEKPDLPKLTPENVDAYLNTLQNSNIKEASPNKRLAIIAVVFVLFMVVTGIIVMQFSNSAGR
jgi:hypothetical protein